MEGLIYHVFNKSIAGYKIFNNDDEYLNIENAFKYYRHKDVPCRFSNFVQSKPVMHEGFDSCYKKFIRSRGQLVDIIAHCIMPTHFHLVLRQLQEDAIPIFIKNALNSYSHYFNLKHHRKGPLWVGRTKKVEVCSDEQLLHLTRYVHINPPTANLVERPEDWLHSSYNDYLELRSDGLSNVNYIMNEMSVKGYREFVNDRIDYQRNLVKIEKLLIELE